MTKQLSGAAGNAYQLMRNDIVSGVLVGGSRLTETDLAAQYGLSRTPIRESLRRLQSEGLIEVIPHRGARVVDWQNFDIEGMYDLRILVECFITRRAATRITPDVVDELTELCDQMEAITKEGKAGDPNTVAAFTELNGRFHGRIAEVADAEYAQPARHILVALPVILRAVHNYAPLGYQRSNSHHRELLEAFRIKDADWAESIMRLHVTASKSAIMDELRRTTDIAVSKPVDS